MTPFMRESQFNGSPREGVLVDVSEHPLQDAFVHAPELVCRLGDCYPTAQHDCLQLRAPSDEALVASSDGCDARLSGATSFQCPTGLEIADLARFLEQRRQLLLILHDERKLVIGELSHRPVDTQTGGETQFRIDFRHFHVTFMPRFHYFSLQGVGYQKARCSGLASEYYLTHFTSKVKLALFFKGNQPLTARNPKVSDIFLE
mgnify:CR=1 FL=1